MCRSLEHFLPETGARALGYDGKGSAGRGQEEQSIGQEKDKEKENKLANIRLCSRQERGFVCLCQFQI